MSQLELRRLFHTIRFDKADVPAAFEPRNLYFREVVRLRIEPHIFFQIMFGNVFPQHFFPLQFSVLHEHDGFSLNQDSKSMGIVRSYTQKPMQEHQNESGAERWKKSL